MNIIDATKIIEGGVLLIPQSYKIVEKDETEVLLKVLDECKTIYNAWSVMSFPLQQDIIDEANMIQMLNAQILKKLHRLYRFYHRHYGLMFDDGDWGEDNSEFSESYRLQKSTQDNIELICEHIRSWEE